ncbi:MAG: DUF362 domain-containing protein [Nitrospirota bacterium]|nr:DUF362 domain-containing protein [Nitrospirota bacterium]
MNRVSIVRQNDYIHDSLRTSLEEALAPLGGMGAFVKSGQRVLIKPNLLSGKAVEKAVTTHPLFIRIVAEMVQEAGGIPAVGDSPGVGSLEKVAEKIGLTPLLSEIGVSLVSFSDAVMVEHPRGKVFKRFEIARPVTEADVIINLPKLKTHGMMTLTCGVKNLFGCVSGLRKVRWHADAGHDYERFAEMLVDLAYMVKPALTIVDGIVGMEGEGPGSGDPRQLGLILAGTDPVAVDRVVCEIVGLSPDELPTLAAAGRLKLGVSSLKEIEVAGDSIGSAKVEDFRFPAKTIDTGMLPGFIRKLLRDALSNRPVVGHEKCTLCHVCVTHCPAQIMSVKDNRITIDYSACIRCFCCHELCPQGTIRIGKGWLASRFG